MGFWENFPYSNFHELNLDWVLKTVRNTVDEFKYVAKLAKETELKVDENRADFNKLVVYVNDYFKNLDVSTEIREIFDNLAESGQLEEILSGALTGFTNVRSFGATGDGVTNDYAAFIRAVEFASGGSVFVPSGTYIIDGVFNGDVNLYGDGVLHNFSYAELDFPNIEGSKPASATPYLTISGLHFKGGVSIVCNPMTGVARNFRIENCVFEECGIVAEHCYHSEILNCEFIHPVKGIELRSCTNMLIDGCQIFSPIIGVNIIPSDNDTANRKGGENCKIISCTMIDGVTGVNALNHNYLWIVNSMIDYFNNGLNLFGSRYAHFTNSYIGCNKVPKNTRSGYIAPASFNGIEINSDQGRDMQSSLKMDDSEIVMYNSLNNDDGKCVYGTNGTLPIVEVTLINSRFTLETGCTADSLVTLNSCYGLTISDNVFTSVNNPTVYVFDYYNYAPGRVNIGFNDFTNCFNSEGSILPISGNVGRYDGESGALTFVGTGEAPVMELPYKIKGSYSGELIFNYSVMSCSDSETLSKLECVCSAYDFNSIIIKISREDGAVIPAGTTVKIGVIIYGTT